nr:ATP-binding protein [uncultured Rhodoferax sp.]
MKTTQDVKDLLAKRLAWPYHKALVQADILSMRLLKGDKIPNSLGWTLRELESAHEIPKDLPRETRLEQLAQRWLEVWQAEDAERQRIAKAERRQRMEREALEWEHAQRARWPNCGVGARFRDCTFDNYTPQNDDQERALAACASWPYGVDDQEGDSRAKNLWIVGTVGTGKTHLATAVLRKEFFVNGQEPGVVTHKGLLDEIRATWDKDTRTRTQDEVIRKYGEDIALLLLDDLGAVNNSEQARTDLFEVIDRRYRNNLSTIITSNLSATELDEALGARIADRLRDGAILVSIEGESYRRPLEVSP